MDGLKIKRREFLGMVTAGMAATGMAGDFLSAIDAKAVGGKRPNLVFLFADQLRADVFGHKGDARAITPNFDRLAAEGMEFCNATASTPVCAPFRASLFTGKYTTGHGMVLNEACMNPNHKAIGYILNDAGYRMGYLGKWHLMDDKNGNIPKGPARLGFQHADLWKAYNTNHQNQNGFYWHEEDGKSVHRKIDGFQTPFWTDEAITFIEDSAKQDRPFALFVSYSPPHSPWTENNVPKKYLDLYENIDFPNPPNFSPHPDPRADRLKAPAAWAKDYVPSMENWRKIYYAMVSQMDDELGRVMAALDKAGVADNTILVYTSDHGEMLGAHGRIQKLIFYDEAARIPFYVRWPGRVAGGHRSDACLNTPDMAPTLLGLLDLPVPPEMEGMDLSHCVLGKQGPEPEFALLQGVGHTFRWRNGFEWRAVRDKRYTYARYRSDGEELLFDNQNDPFQMRNLSKDPGSQEILSRLRAGMEAKMKEINDGFHPHTWYRENFMAKGDAYSVVAGAQGEFKGPYEAIPSSRGR